MAVQKLLTETGTFAKTVVDLTINRGMVDIAVPAAFFCDHKWILHACREDKPDEQADLDISDPYVAGRDEPSCCPTDRIDNQ